MSLTKYCYNGFVGRMLLTRAQNISIAASIAILIPILISSNAAVIIALYKTKQLNLVFNRNIAILCLSDCISGLASLPLHCVLFAVFGHERICWYEQLTVMMLQTNSHFTAYMMAVIALQRYLKARPTLAESPFTEKLLSKWGTISTVSLVLLLSILHALISTNFFNTISNRLPNIIMMFVNICIILSVYICYIRLFRGIRVHVTNNAMLNEHSAACRQSSTATTISTNQPTYFHELAKTMYYILISFAVCSIPYLITDFYTGYYSIVLKENAPQTLRYLYYMSYWPMSLNGINNALILLYRNKKAAKFIKDSLTINYCKASTTETSERSRYESSVVERTVKIEENAV